MISNDIYIMTYKKGIDGVARNIRHAHVSTGYTGYMMLYASCHQQGAPQHQWSVWETDFVRPRFGLATDSVCPLCLPPCKGESVNSSHLSGSVAMICHGNFQPTLVYNQQTHQDGRQHC